MTDKLMSMSEAVKKFVRDGDLVFLSGFGNCNTYSVVHELIRQKKRNLKVTKAAGGIMFDQLIGANVTNHIITSHTWNGIGPQPAWNYRRATEKGIPAPLTYNEQSLFGVNMSYFAGYMNIPFMPIRSLVGSSIYDTPKEVGKKAAIVKSPFSDEEICVVPAIKPDVGFLHVQRVDEAGNAQMWGVIGDSKFGINACKKIIVSAEEIVDRFVISESPEKTMVVEFRVDAIVHEPWGGHPGGVQGFYYNDLEYVFNYSRETETIEGWEKWLDKWVLSVSDRQEYLKVLGVEKLERLRAKSLIRGAVDYGF
ncbi:MAG: CoA transferase subunit A [Candidatus Helarchaeota archaeon]|nr:CoA transferase subunit A [Candidatus Helarchaeota archaeon]